MTIPPAIIAMWLLLTLFLGIVTTSAIWSRQLTRARGFTVLAFLLVSPITLATLAYSLGWPLPLVNGITKSEGEYNILGVKLVVDKGIYLLLDDYEVEEPRYYVIPWSKELADKLQELMEQNEGSPEGLIARIPPFEWSWDNYDLEFDVLPMPKWLPDKPVEAEPFRFEDSI